VRLSQTSPEQVEVYRFPWLAAALIPALAIFFQAFFPVKFPILAIFDVPLLVTIFLGVTRRNPVTGLLTGCFIGLVQDSLMHHSTLGVYGIAKTVVGFGASSLGVKLDVENAASRFLVTYGFYLLHQFLYFSVQRGLVGQALGWAWGHQLFAALANAALAVVLFAVLDRFKQRNW
jgi:rod shape-determining protein MreD